MKIGLYSGSFNPVHVGHLIIAEHMALYSDLDKIWMVVSPQNPLKPKKSLAKDYDRLHLVNLATQDNPLIEVSNIEFGLPKPSYTIDTLTYLKEKYPKHEFSLIMGGDSLSSLHRWKNYEQIIANHTIYVFSRPDYEMGPLEHHENVKVMEAPLLQISSSMIRSRLKESLSVRYLVSDAVNEYLEGCLLYR